MLENEIQLNVPKTNDHNNDIKTILDLGCGNGRNSLYITKKYGASRVVLVDSDIDMLNWAQKLFSLHGIPINIICSRVEEIAGDSMKFYEQIECTSFDIVIFSYVIQYVDPVYYPLLFDFCKKVFRKYIVINVFWNPSRLGAGEFTRIGSVNWYGLTYEELVTYVASRFHLLNDRIYKTDISIVINMLLSEGYTPFSSVLKRSHNYFSNRIRKRIVHKPGAKNRTKSIDLNELACIKLLSPFYPTEVEGVRIEFIHWIGTSDKVVTLPLMAAKFLWLCRLNKLPVTLYEISRDFGIKSRLF